MTTYRELAERQRVAVAERATLKATLGTLEIRARMDRVLQRLGIDENPFAGSDHQFAVATQRAADLEVEIADFQTAGAFVSYASAAAVVTPIDERIVEVESRRPPLSADREERDAYGAELSAAYAARSTPVAAVYDSIRAEYPIFAEVPIVASSVVVEPLSDVVPPPVVRRYISDQFGQRLAFPDDVLLEASAK